jgi:hypothetical protein
MPHPGRLRRKVFVTRAIGRAALEHGRDGAQIRESGCVLPLAQPDRVF